MTAAIILAIVVRTQLAGALFFIALCGILTGVIAAAVGWAERRGKPR